MMPTDTDGHRHPTAIVSADAEVHESVELGPGVVIEGDVRIGAGSILRAHTIVHQYTQIGERNQIGPHAVLGGAPQHKAYDGSETWLKIGDDNHFREFFTASRAFERGGETRIGSNCMFMAGTHVAHDCHLGDNISMTNYAVLAGHIEVGDNCVFSGFAGGHQFVRVGKLCMIGPHVVLRKDALPFTIVAEHPARHYRLNSIGLKRNGVTGERYKALEQAFRTLRRGDHELADIPDTEEIRYLKDWLAADSRFGIMPFAKPGKR